MAGNSMASLDLEDLSQKLATGFEILLDQVKDLAQKEARLRKNLEEAKKNHSQLSPAGSSIESLDPLNTSAEPEGEANGDGRHSQQTAILMASEAIREAMDAYKTMKMKPARKVDISARTCPMEGQITAHQGLEQDFTTSGVQGNLQCPFARMAENSRRRALVNGAADPIAAEFHPDQASIPSNAPSAQGRGKCPIRFLDQHSPEEVAKYFENHKHEIPRSHEICVKRYQQNEHSIRQLDAKYGNLVNMIQGLGVKHKQYLPADEENKGRPKGPGSVEAVEVWADGVSHKSLEQAPQQNPPENGIPADEEEREPHFARSLREVRVGESPSRPWGISVPPAQKPSQSAILSDRRSEPVDIAQSEITMPKSIQQEQARKRPIDHGVNSAVPDDVRASQARDTSATKAEEHDSPSHPRIVFNGPVFFGYSADEVGALLKSANLGNGRG